MEGMSACYTKTITSLAHQELKAKPKKLFVSSSWLVRTAAGLSGLIRNVAFFGTVMLFQSFKKGNHRRPCGWVQYNFCCLVETIICSVFWLRLELFPTVFVELRSVLGYSHTERRLVWISQLWLIISDVLLKNTGLSQCCGTFKLYVGFI